MASGLGRVAPGIAPKLNLAVDLALLSVALISAVSPTIATTLGRAAHFGGLLVAPLAAWIVTATALRHYDPPQTRTLFDDLAMVALLVLAELTLLAGFAVLSPEVGVGKFLLLEVPFAVAARLAFRPLITREGTPEDVLIVGMGPLGRATAFALESGRSGQRVVGHLRLPGETTPPSWPGRALGPSSQLGEVLAAFAVSEVYLAGGPHDADAVQAAIKVCETRGVAFALPQYCFRFDRARAADARGGDGYLHFVSMEARPAQMALKRLFDIAVSGAALWLLLPLLLTVALLVKLTSRGPVLFRQVRVGLHGHTFRMLKFRSMVADAERQRDQLAALNEQQGPVFKIQHDPRVTPLGRFMRRHSIDELPQLVNVLRGDMSVVGPRPPLPAEVAKYQGWQRRRLSVRPGLTCIWQVSGRSQITFDEWMYLDMRYIDHWSLGQDLSLVLKTVPVVVNGRGAA